MGASDGQFYCPLDVEGGANGMTKGNKETKLHNEDKKESQATLLLW